MLTYYLIGIVALVGSLLVQGYLRSTYGKWSQRANSAQLTGRDTALAILRANGITDVRVEAVQGTLTDHYDPTAKVVRLSKDNYARASVAGMAVAAHEVGHAIQHHKAYAPLKVRTALLPIANIGSQFGPILAVFGLILGQGPNLLLNIGIALFAAAVLFQLVTLPIEFDASRRAMNQMQALGIVTPTDSGGARSVLNAAALTYVAAAATAIGYLLYFLTAARD